MDVPSLEPDNSPPSDEAEMPPDNHCPICSAALLQEKCKVVCRSPRCMYRIIFNCSEF